MLCRGQKSRNENGDTIIVIISILRLLLPVKTAVLYHHQTQKQKEIYHSL